MAAYEMNLQSRRATLPRRDSAATFAIGLFLTLAVATCASAPQSESGSSPADSGPPPTADSALEATSPPTTVSADERSVLDGVYARSQANRGERTFQQVCAACHGINEFSGGRFRIRWSGQTVADIFEFVSMLMPEGNPGSLSPDEYADVLAYILSENGYPSGESELPADASALRSVRLE